MQNQTMACADARHLVHLAVGDDTHPDEEKRLAEHLHACSDCRAYHAGTMDAMRVLEQARDEDSVDIPAGVVWSAISRTVKARSRVDASSQRRTFNGAVAALCACSLTLALVTIVQGLPLNSQAPSGSVPTAMSVSNQPFEPQQALRLSPVHEKDGTISWQDQNGNIFYPDVLSSLPDTRNVDF